MPTPANPSDVARLGHRYQLRAEHTGSARTLVASRVQNVEPSHNHNTEVFNQLGGVDPAGKASESPEFRITFEELVHSVAMDLLLAGKAANGTSWNLFDYINNSLLKFYVLERNNSNAVIGERAYENAVVAEIQWRWQVGQAIQAMYTIDARLARHWAAAFVPHGSWGAFDTTSPGGIKAKDARLFLGGTTSGYRMYRVQSMTLRATFRDNPVKELGSRPLVGYVVEPPTTMLDIDIAAADQQPDDYLFEPVGSPVQYYDYVNPIDFGASAIRIYDPDASEGASVLRSWKLENLTLARANPIRAQVRGLATKRYSFMIPKAATAETGGVLMYAGDLS